MRNFSRRISLFLLILVCSAAWTGCSSLKASVKSARGSFPVKYLFHPSYQEIGAMYKSEPGLAIEYLERLCRKHPDNVPFRLTLADMYKDRGMVNDAIRLWFEILSMSGGQGGSQGTLQVYFIPIVPYQEEGMRPYGKTIDKALAYFNIGLIYYQNAFYEEASQYYSKAAEYTAEPARKAEFFHLAGQAVGAKKVEYFVSDKDGKPYRKIGDRTVPADPLQYRRKEMAFYMMALTLDFANTALREKIEQALAEAQTAIAKGE